jgi:hypothetical protein
MSKMSNPDFKSYQDVFDAYKKDIEQVISIGNRLIASAKDVHADKQTKPTAKLEKLKTIDAQWQTLDETKNAARLRYDAAIDSLDEKSVQEIRGLCSYAEGTGQGGAAISYLLEECKAFDKAKGDYALRRRLHSQIVDVMGSVADAVEGKKVASEGPTVLSELEAIADPEAASAFYREKRAEIHGAHDAQINSQNIE